MCALARRATFHQSVSNPDTETEGKIKVSAPAAEERSSRRAAMEIGPIPGIRAFSTVKARPNGPELSAVFDIDGLTRGRDSLGPEARIKAAGADEEDEEDEMNPEDRIGSETDGSSLAPPSSVSFFA
jgi:hypothetical protein